MLVTTFVDVSVFLFEMAKVSCQQSFIFRFFYTTAFILLDVVNDSKHLCLGQYCLPPASSVKFF